MFLIVGEVEFVNGVVMIVVLSDIVYFGKYFVFCVENFLEEGEGEVVIGG